MPTFVMGILGLVLIVAFGFGLHKLSERQKTREEEERAKRDASERLRKRELHEAGTHNEDGEPLCTICKDEVATEGPFLIVRSEDLRAWAKQNVGAPARLSIVQKTSPPKYCRVDAEVVHAEFEAFLIAFEQTRRAQVRDDEVELQHFEKVGADARVRARIEGYAKRVKKDGFPTEREREPVLVAVK